jgi:predicted AlkP superfamily phosphohydrolase/phosphomutase
MAIFKKSKDRRPRVCVIGLDGVPYSLLLDLARREIMPFMAQLIGAGHLHRLRASLPEISAVSWTDFMTGTNSGTHGIFGFTDLKPGSYALRFPNFQDLKTDTFWDALGRRGKKCFIINQPSTYPARPLSGVLVSGFVALDLAKGVYPQSLQATLERMGYRIDIDTLKARDDVDFLWLELEATLAGRKRALEYFWPQDWDYFEFVVTGTDRLHHFLWSAFEQEDHPHHRMFLDYYRKIDELVATIVRSFRDLTGGDKGLYLLSDHGFCHIDQEVYLNAWLERKGFLKFAVAEPQALEDIAPGSAAFALDPSRIYLNSHGRFPKGTVGDAERKTLKKEIAEVLGRLEFEGRRVIRRVFDAEETYTGPLVSSGPDLLVVSEPGFDLKGSVKKKEVFGRTSLQGMHTWDDAFFWSVRPAGEDLAIRDLASLILEDYH